MNLGVPLVVLRNLDYCQPKLPVVLLVGNCSSECETNVAKEDKPNYTCSNVRHWTLSLSAAVRDEMFLLVLHDNPLEVMEFLNE